MSLLHALRLVEMQLNRHAPDPPPDDGDLAGARHIHEPSPVVRAFDARCCHICGCRYPSFGFGPPLAPRGQERWACLAHRSQMERILSDGRDPDGSGAQVNLL